MTSAKYDLSIDQGATWSITLVLKKANKLFMDLTGYTGIGKIKKSVSDPVSSADFEVSFPDPTKGKIVLKLSSEVTSSITFSRGVYDFKIISPLPEETVTRIMHGIVTINEEVSKEDVEDEEEP